MTMAVREVPRYGAVHAEPLGADDPQERPQGYHPDRCRWGDCRAE
jgi:hypothetical protein